MISVRRLAAALLVVAAWVPVLHAQAPPRPTTAQRKLLEVLVAAVDRAAAGGPTSDATWERHVLRVSDGAHYVALRAFVPAGASAPASAVYVRVASHRDATETTRAERSAVSEWLNGLRSDPLPLQPGRSMSVPAGEMPVGGAAASSRRSSEANDATAALRLLSLQREREARARAERAAERTAALEQAGGVTTGMLPFEDFDFESRPLPAANGALEIRRSITAGPGLFDVYVAWTSGRGDASGVRVIRYALNLPPATGEFAVSDIIVAERAQPLAAPWPPSQQSSHPYAIGALDISPAARNELAGDGTLGLVYQVVNAAPDAAGKPDVDVDFAVMRLVDDKATPFGSLMRQHYDGTTLPADFDVARGHPLFGAVRAPLTTFARGRYRVVVTATDRRTNRRATSEATFVVRPTPRSLLAEAPALGRPFRRDAALTDQALRALASALRATPASEGAPDALAAALDSLAAGRFVDLVQQAAPAATGDHARALVLRAAGLFGLGDSPRAVLSLLQQAATAGAPSAATHFLTGAARAASGDERGAVEAWLASRDAGLPDRVVAAPVIDAYLRLGDLARASAMARAVLDGSPRDGSAAQVLAATQLAAGRPLEALATLDGATLAPNDEGAFLTLHAMYAVFVGDGARWTSPGMLERFQAAGRTYADAGRPRADLVREWLAISAPAAP